MTSPLTPTLESIQCLSTGWINKYLCKFRLADGTLHPYEVVSRKDPEAFTAAMTARGQGQHFPPDAVCMVPIIDDTELLLIREFRYPLNSWCLSFPAGLIDPGEDLEQAVARELSEETGFTVDSAQPNAVRFLAQPGFSSTGLTDESVQVCLVKATASGAAHPEPSELIEPFLVPLYDLRSFLEANTLSMGTRAQLILEALAGGLGSHW